MGYMPGRQYIIEHIIRNNPNLKKEVLVQLSVESLQIIRVQTELELLNKTAKRAE
jgi:hypothetical protein